MNSARQQRQMAGGSSASMLSLHQTSPWTSGCYARIAGLEMMLEIRQQKRLQRLRRLGAGLVLVGSAAIAASMLVPF
ncbi:MAG: hypothetical protein ACKO2L_20885 [Planctomycetaceae bacterium]